MLVASRDYLSTLLSKLLEMFGKWSTILGMWSILIMGTRVFGRIISRLVRFRWERLSESVQFHFFKPLLVYIQYVNMKIYADYLLQPIIGFLQKKGGEKVLRPYNE